MPKAPTTPAHPTLDIKCRDCKFWHPDMIETMIFMPGSQQPLPKKILHAQQQIVPAEATQVEMSCCFFNPQWVLTASISYCAHWEE